jgi:hypothetical protein
MKTHSLCSAINLLMKTATTPFRLLSLQGKPKPKQPLLR